MVTGRAELDLVVDEMTVDGLRHMIVEAKLYRAGHPAVEEDFDEPITRADLRAFERRTMMLKGFMRQRALR